jgi:hypothetical protein
MRKRLNIPQPDDPDYRGPGEIGLYTIYMNEKLVKIFGKETEIQFEIQEDNSIVIYSGLKFAGRYVLEKSGSMRDWLFVEEDDLRKIVASIIPIAIAEKLVRVF